MTTKFLLQKHKGISRIDLEAERTHGWIAQKSAPGRNAAMFFSDREHGGRYSSLKSATDWRDRTDRCDSPSNYRFLARLPISPLKLLILAFVTLCSPHIAHATDYRPIVLDSSYEHDKWQTLPRDQVFSFAAFTTSFDGPDDDNGDGLEDKWGIPQ